jgi:hypothetical protein
MTHWSNLQPLTPFENQSKGGKFPSFEEAQKVLKEYWPNAAIGYYD